jgi:hypothetical protein
VVTANVTPVHAFFDAMRAIAFTGAGNGTTCCGAGDGARVLLNQIFTDFGKDAFVGR